MWKPTTGNFPNHFPNSTKPFSHSNRFVVTRAEIQMYLFRLYPGTFAIALFFLASNPLESGIKWPVCVSHFNSKVYVSRRLTTPATRSHFGSGWDILFPFSIEYWPKRCACLFLFPNFDFPKSFSTKRNELPEVTSYSAFN